ncbi:MAG: Rrf2 family transcriptional regulator [Rectinemataceae bacterium]
MITTRSRYGLRLLIELAEKGDTQPIDLGGIAERQGIPEQYLSKLVIPLKAAGIVKASRGAKGGYSLARPASEIDLYTVVEVLEGRSSLLECTADPGLCARSGECKTLPVWIGLDKTIRNYLQGMTVADAAHNSPEYSI